MSDPTRAQLLLLLRAYQSGELEFKVTAAARWFASKAGIGIVDNRKWRWQATDRQLVRAYLIAAMKIDNPDLALNSFADLTRVEAAALGNDEKYGGRGPRDKRVLVRGIHGTVRINGVTSAAIASSCLELHVNDISSVQHDCLVFVENFEAVIGFEKVRLEHFPFLDPLLVYRGDAINPTNGSKLFAAKATTPVVAFVDFDPQGLNIASSLPNVTGLVLPTEIGEIGRTDLFINQLHLLGQAEKYPPGWRSAIEAMRTSRLCLTQEYMIARGMACRLCHC